MPNTNTKPKKGVRLFKALRELNVKASTVVETLDAQGIEMDDKLRAGDINAKLTAEQYEALLREFKEDKEKHDRVVQQRDRRRRESGEDVAAPAAPVKEAAAEPVAKKAKPVEPAAEESAAKAPAAEEPAVEEPAAEAPVAPAKPVIEAPEPEVEPVAPAEPVIETPEPVAETEPEGEEEATPEAPAAKAKPAEATKAAPEPEPVAEAEPAAEPEPAEAPTAEAEPAAAVTDTDDEDATEAVEGQAGMSEDVAEEEDTLRADRYKLSGPKVVDKIDLSGIEAGRRRRRKKTDDDAGSPKPAGKKASDAPPAGGSGGRDAGRRRDKRRRGAPRADEGEAADKVNETLAKLRGTGGSGPGGRTRQRRRRLRREERAAEREKEFQEMMEDAQKLRVTEFVSTGELAELMTVPVTEIIQKAFAMGMMISINQRLDADSITLIADEFGREVEFLTDAAAEEIEIEEDDPEDLVDRAPIVTIMGHVDHGKTSLLDYIREANVVAGESGGITQHIGAYQVAKGDRKITFLDTPGHEAFTAMRARGAQVTDVVILVVAADDRVMPQTIEAINHSRAAGVPIVVAINKVDKPDVNPDRIMAQLSEQNVIVEQYGGNVQCELVSAHTGQGVDELLEKVLIESDLLELQANPDRYAVGSVIESRLDKGRGVVATILVENGTLSVGDPFVAGTFSGRVRAMFDERDQRVEEAGPATPVAILGFNGAPEVGDRFLAMEDEREAREIAQRRNSIQREAQMRARKHVSLDDLSRRLALGELSYLNLIIKADVGGSVEALSDALLKLSTSEVAVSIVHSGVGAITESDVMLAAASDAVIFGFQVRPVPGVRTVAEREEIDIRTYSVIYDAIEDVRDALEGLLEPEQREQTLASIEVRETFRVPKVGTIAGCYVVEGKVHRNNRVRLIREGVVIYEGKLDSLRRFKDDVREVSAGYECGLSIAGYNDIKVGDTIESFEIVEEKRQLA